jgi:hypothetical protein
MARGKGLGEYVDPFEQAKKKKQLDDQKTMEEKKEKEPQPIDEDQKETENLSTLSKYKKVPKYKTYVAHNVRIPKEMRSDLELIAKKLGIKLGKNTGFFQEFTIDALKIHIEKAKKELGIDD